jgi:hypothetical protein
MVNEWCNVGLEPLIEERKNIALESITWWFSQIQHNNCIVIADNQ